MGKERFVETIGQGFESAKKVVENPMLHAIVTMSSLGAFSISLAKGFPVPIIVITGAVGALEVAFMIRRGIYFKNISKKEKKGE